MAEGARKRKQTVDSGPITKRSRFPGKPQHHITTTATKSAYPNGEINVKNFLKSHENEVKSLEHAIKAARKGLSRRAFQDVPRELRRRTASHNPQRVPKRLRRRAKQEAKEDNTPITRGKSGSGVGKDKKKHLRKKGIETSKKIWEERARKKANQDDRANKAIAKAKPACIPRASNQPNTRRKFPAPAVPPTPPSRFRRRQREKTWLPTHLWHTKRARMTEPKKPLWRFAIPLAPVVKSYRLTHRAATQRGAVAWDMSYMSTISLEGTEASIMGLLKGLHFARDITEDPWQGRGRAKKWRNGTRTWEGWIYEREAKPIKKLALVTVIWCVPEMENCKRKAFIRVHPSAFFSLWEEVVRIAKVQRPSVMVNDLRFEIGSIEIMGPAAAETLVSILSPVSKNSTSDAPESVWARLASVTDPASLPSGALLAFEMSDPRLDDPPTTTLISRDHSSISALTETLVQWPLDHSQISPTIFDPKARLAGQRSLPSQKSINRRKSSCTLGERPEARSTDPKIPVLVYASRETRSWTVLLPWKCVMPVWRGITRYPVSTGSTPRFGGLKERRQVNYEKSLPMFPFDYPGTSAGWIWEQQQREVRKQEWIKHPKGKRIEWSTIDLGEGRKGEIDDPWACAWERLLPPASADTTRVNSVSTDANPPLAQLSSKQAIEIITGQSSSADLPPEFGLTVVKVTMVQRGTPTDCARIYRLPSKDAKLREKWLSIAQKSHTRPAGRKHFGGSDSAQPHIRYRELARGLLDPTVSGNGPPKVGEEDYPSVPDEEDLVGFVTTGNYNLAEGIPTAVANIALHRLCSRVSGEGELAKEDRLCIVRQAGHTVGRLARWNMV